MRAEFFLEPDLERGRLQAGFEAEVARRFEMDWRIHWWGQRQRVAILVSELDAEIVF